MKGQLMRQRTDPFACYSRADSQQVLNSMLDAAPRLFAGPPSDNNPAAAKIREESL
jgi:hypothetical protein